MLAKSRLKSKSAIPQITSEREQSSVKKERVGQVLVTQKKMRVRSKYLKHLPVLLFSFPFYFGLLYIFTQINPEAVKNILVPNSYLPLLLLIYFATLFSCTFFMLSFKRGIVISSVVTLLLFLRLQQVQFEVWWLLLVLLITMMCVFMTRTQKTIVRR